MFCRKHSAGNYLSIIHMSKYKTRKTIASVLVSVATAVTLSGGSLLVPMVASAQTDQATLIAQLQAQILALQAQLNALVGGGSAPASSASCSFTRDLTLGSKGDDVTCLQNYLTGTGHFTFAGGATGYFGSVTKASVAAWQAANSVSPAAGYFGKISQAKYNSMAVVTPLPPPPPPPGGTGGGTTTPPPASGGGLTVAAPAAQVTNSLAPGNVTAQAVRVPFTKFTLTAGASDATINGVTVERVGFGADANFSGLVLLAEDGTQLDIEKTLGSDHRATIGGTFKVPAGMTKTYTVAGNMANNATRAGQVVAVSVVAINTTETVSGTLPITGAAHTINSSLTIGSVTMTRGSIDPGSSQSKEVGTTGYTFSAVRTTAGSAEKVYLQSMRWNQTGSAGSGDLANVKTYVDGTAYDTTVSSDGKYYTSVFPENGGKGLLIDKGFSKELSIKGDIVGGSSRTVIFDVAKRTDILLVGETYGFGIKAPQSETCSSNTTSVACYRSVEDPWYRGAVVTVSTGSMTVSSGSHAPAANIAVNSNDQVLGGWEVVVKGEDISVGSMIFRLGAVGNEVSDITNITLVNQTTGVILAGPVDGMDTTDPDGTATFSSSVTFPVGTTKITLKGRLSGSSGDFVSSDTVTASTTVGSEWTTVRGQTTGNTITPTPSSAVSGQTMTVRAGSLTVSVSPTPLAQTVIANASQFLFSNYILDATASGEDQRLTGLPIEYNFASGNANDLTNCQMYDGATSLTTGGHVVNPTARSSSTLFAFDGNGLTVAKSSSKTLGLKCDLRGGSSGSYKFGIDGAEDDNFTGVSGISSGLTITEVFTDSEGQLMTGAASGTLRVLIDSGSTGSLSYRIVGPGATVDLVKFILTATNEDINLKQIALQLSGAASNTPSSLVGRKVTLWDGTTNIGEALFTTGDFATSTALTALTIPRGGSKILTVKGTIEGISDVSGPMTHSGDLLAVDFDANNLGINGTYGTGKSSGSNMTPLSAADTTSTGVRIMKAYPELSHEALSASERTLVAGDNRTAYKFKMTAKNGDIALAKLSFKVSSSTLAATTTKFSLYAYANATYSSPGLSYPDTNNPDGLVNAGNCYNGFNSNTSPDGLVIEIYPDSSGCNTGTTTLVIPSGESRWFRLAASVASLAAAATAETLQFQLEGDAAFQTVTPGVGAGSGDILGKVSTVETDTHNDFIWSPHSTTTLTTTLEDLDWTNGYNVVGLPGSNMTVETLSK